MKVCMLAYTFYDTDTRVRRYAEALIGRGDEVDAIALRRPGEAAQGVLAGVHVYRLQKRRHTEKGPVSYLVKLLLFFMRSAWLVTQHTMRQRYDLIHVHSVPDFEVFATLIARLAGTRVILDIHDIVPELYASKFHISHNSLIFRLLVAVERLSVNYANHVIIANHLWHDRLIKRSARREDCSTILNYPDRQVFCQRSVSNKRGDQFVMFYPGTLSQHQGVDLVIKAMARLRSEAPNLRFVIYGDGHERQALLDLAKECQVADQVTIRSERPATEVAAMMARSDLGIEPKRKSSFANEALSTKIFEFMAVGVPVLASDTIVHQLYFKDSVEYFESESIEDLASTIVGLMRDSTRRDGLRARGFRLVSGYDWHDKKQEYLALVDQIVAHGKGHISSDCDESMSAAVDRCISAVERR